MSKFIELIEENVAWISERDASTQHNDSLVCSVVLNLPFLYVIDQHGCELFSQVAWTILAH